MSVPSGTCTSMSRRLCCAAPEDLDVAARRAPLRGHVDRARARQELPGQRALHPLHLRGCALRDDPAAVLAGARPQVDEVVGAAHRLLVVLDHDHRVAEVAQPLQRGDQLGVVALVQPDRGLVEDVEHAHQRGADLRRQPDALRLAARERGGGAVHRQVADADVLQELQSLDDLAQDQPGDVPVGFRELDVLQPLQRPARRERAEVLDPRAGHEHRCATRAGAARRRTPGRRAAT